MEGPIYIFALQDKDRNFWRLDSALNQVVLGTQPYFFKVSPIGWNDTAIKNERHRRLWAIDRTVTIPFTYVMDAGRILKHIAYNLGPNEKVYLSISVITSEYVPGVDYIQEYKQIFHGQVNIPDFIHNNTKVTATTVEDGLPRYIKANENTPFEIPMSAGPLVKMDGIRLRESLKYGLVDGFNYTDVRYIPSFFLLGNDGDSAGVQYLSSSYETISGAAGADETYVRDSDNYFFKNQTLNPITINITGTIKYKSPQNDTIPASGSSLRIKTNRDNGFGSTLEYIILNVTPVEGVEASVLVNVDITVNPGEKLFLYGRTGTVNETLYKFEFLEGSELTFKFITRRDPTYVRHLTGQYIWNWLISKVTDGAFVAAASAYLLLHSDKLFTCGNAIRGIEDAVMKIKLSDFIKWWDCFDSVGIKKIGNAVDIDRKQNLIDFSAPIHLGEAAYETFKDGFAKDYLFNNVEIGYPEIKSDVGALNGNEEFNSKMLFSLGTVDNPATIDKVSPFKSSCYEQEKIRVTVLDKTTTDYKSDNDIFVNVVNPVIVAAAGAEPAHYLLDRSLNASVTAGLIEPESIWNLAISPKRMLLNNSAFIRSCTYKMDTMILGYRSHDKNNKVVCNGIAEKADLPVSEMTAPFFLPWILEGDFPIPFDLLKTLDTNPLTGFSFNAGSTLLKGVLNEISIAHSTKAVQRCVFLSAPDNNLSLLETYEG